MQLEQRDQPGETGEERVDVVRHNQHGLASLPATLYSPAKMTCADSVGAPVEMRRIYGRRRPVPHEDRSIGQEHNRYRGAARGGRGARLGKRPKVKVTIGDYTYRSSLASMGGVPMVSLSAENRAGAGVAGGDEVEVELAVDLEERPSPCRPTSPRRWTRSLPLVPLSTTCRTATRAGTSSRSRGRRQTRRGNGGSPSRSMPSPRAAPLTRLGTTSQPTGSMRPSRHWTTETWCPI